MAVMIITNFEEVCLCNGVHMRSKNSCQECITLYRFTDLPYMGEIWMKIRSVRPINFFDMEKQRKLVYIPKYLEYALMACHLYSSYNGKKSNQIGPLNEKMFYLALLITGFLIGQFQKNSKQERVDWRYGILRDTEERPYAEIQSGQ